MCSKPRVSAILIVRDEATQIRACLESIQWIDDIIVLDSGSQDDTVAICQQYTAHVYRTDWQGYGIQKNRALSYAQADWVLSLDADERVSPALRKEIEHRIDTAHEQQSGFEIPRMSNYCGKFMYHSGWTPDYVLRLFRREQAQFSDVPIHEKVLIEQGKTSKLKQVLIHYAFEDLEEVLDKVNRYSTASAQLAHDQGKKGSLSKAISHGLWAFIRTYFIRSGFLDGKRGLMLAISNAEGTYYRYVKLMLLQSETKHQE